MSRENLSCVISGIFKYKPEIDRTISEFRDLGVLVLAPETGWIARPAKKVLRLPAGGFHPLPSERGMNVGEVEDNFLVRLGRADFVYVESPEGYVGNSMALEIGYGVGLGKPIFSRFNIDTSLDLDPLWASRMVGIEVAIPVEVVARFANLENFGQGIGFGRVARSGGSRRVGRQVGYWKYFD